jgi:ferric-dicitrate binding protein FerR (iron transport regulator)
MQEQRDIVESLIRAAGRRAEPPETAARQVYAAASAAFHRKTARRRERRRLFFAAAAAAAIAAVALVWNLAPPTGGGGELARIERVAGAVERARGEDWVPVQPAADALDAGSRIRTQPGGRAALALAGGESLRLAGNTEVMLDAPGRIYVERGTVYIDSGAQPGAPLEVVTPAGTARDLGTQFELLVSGAALRLRVREGAVAIDRGGRSLTGSAGEEIAIDSLGSVSRGTIAPDSPAWQWAESIAPAPDMDGKPATALIVWAARETGRRLRYESPLVERRAATVILHGDIRHLAPLAALEAMLATTDLECVLVGDTMEIRARDAAPPEL